MKALNEMLIERKVEARYVTLLLILYHQHSHRFTMANAGAMPPMICRGGEIIKLRAEGVPLGLLESREYEETSFLAQPGDVILLYSDGVSDHMSPSGQEYGRGRISQVLRENFSKPASDIVSAIFRDLDRFNRVMFDDQTLLAMKVRT